ncbi:MAG: EamA family transporter [Coprobacillus sp.]|nr:EamA family transporter [Coprobacillus sp.]
MIYLIFAIISSALVSIIMRYSEKYIDNNISMLSINYLMCLILAGIHMGFHHLYIPLHGMNQSIILGIINGILYLSGFILLQRNINKNGIILSSLFMKLGILIPMLVSIFIFKELPSIIQLTGFIIAIISIIFMNIKKEETNINFKFGLLLLLIINGITDTMSKIFDEVGNTILSEQFLFYTFLFAFILCIVLTFIKKQNFYKNEVIYGLLIGIPNYYSARFLLESLQSVPAVMVYPTYSVGTIIVVTIVGIFIFKETLYKYQKISMIGILITLILLNI